jgi:hypothetical protein
MTTPFMTVIASEAQQSMRPRNRKLDCFVASLRAMTGLIVE